MTSAFPRRAPDPADPLQQHPLDLLDRLVRERLRPDQYRLGADRASPTRSVRRADRASTVIDARGAGDLDALDLGWQKFVGREVRLAAPHGLDRPIVMDACVDQPDGYRFVYCLPFARGPAADRGHLLQRPTRRSTATAHRRADRRPMPQRRAGGSPTVEHEEAGRAAGGDGRRFRRLLARRATAPRGSACAAASSIPPPAIRCPTRCGSRC